MTPNTKEFNECSKEIEQLEELRTTPMENNQTAMHTELMSIFQNNSCISDKKLNQNKINMYFFTKKIIN